MPYNMALLLYFCVGFRKPMATVVVIKVVRGTPAFFGFFMTYAGLLSLVSKINDKLYSNEMV
jgi:ABC-type arginine/histidine transport system permease subunit